MRRATDIMSDNILSVRRGSSWKSDEKDLMGRTTLNLKILTISPISPTRLQPSAASPAQPAQPASPAQPSPAQPSPAPTRSRGGGWVGADFYACICLFVCVSVCVCVSVKKTTAVLAVYLPTYLSTN
jgi:hypothetical protein